MAIAQRCLVDTNILLRITRPQDAQYQLVQDAINGLNRQGVELRFSHQNAAEFWNVCTRPTARNGFGFSSEETQRRLASIERIMVFVADSEQVYSLWRRLVADHNVRGVQVRDAHLVATMQAHEITHILTLNHRDFARYSEIQAIHPSEVHLEVE